MTASKLYLFVFGLCFGCLCIGRAAGPFDANIFRNFKNNSTVFRFGQGIALILKTCMMTSAPVQEQSS